MVKVLDLITTVVYSNKSSLITNKKQKLTTGLKKIHGLYQLTSATMFHLKILHLNLVLTVLMFLATNAILKTT